MKLWKLLAFLLVRIWQKDWEALKIWKNIIRDYDNKYKARAAFNSAIIYERLGKIEKALGYIQQSIAAYKSLKKYEKDLATAQSLKSTLEKRNIEVSKLKLQEGE